MNRDAQEDTNEHRISYQRSDAGRVRQRELKSWVVGLEEAVRGQPKLRVMPEDTITDTDEIPLQYGVNASGYGHSA
jgi:hypothetical protein